MTPSCSCSCIVLSYTCNIPMSVALQLTLCFLVIVVCQVSMVTVSQKITHPIGTTALEILDETACCCWSL